MQMQWLHRNDINDIISYLRAGWNGTNDARPLAYRRRTRIHWPPRSATSCRKCRALRSSRSRAWTRNRNVMSNRVPPRDQLSTRRCRSTCSKLRRPGPWYWDGWTRSTGGARPRPTDTCRAKVVRGSPTRRNSASRRAYENRPIRTTRQPTGCPTGSEAGHRTRCANMLPDESVVSRDITNFASYLRAWESWFFHPIDSSQNRWIRF